MNATTKIEGCWGERCVAVNNKAVSVQEHHQGVAMQLVKRYVYPTDDNIQNMV